MGGSLSILSLSIKGILKVVKYPGKMRKYFSAGKSRSAPAYKAYIPQNHNFPNVEGNNTMGKSHPLLIGEGMRSTSPALHIVLSTTVAFFSMNRMHGSLNIVFQ